MVCCELDDEVSGEALGWTLPAWQALLFHRFLPSCGGLVVYITLICFDLALVVEHFRTGANIIGALCVVLLVLPSLASLMFTLAAPPPGLQTDDSAASIAVQRDDLQWILQQIINFFAFPVAAICRYCHQVFWSMEAVCAAHAHDTARARAALQRVRAPSPLELYLFLQAFLHAAPHALINILDLLSYKEQPSFDKISVQSVSIVTSIVRMASTATIYRRFEREKICGRRYPWALDTEQLIQKNNIDDTKSVEPESNATESVAVVAVPVTNNFSPAVTRNTIMNNLNTSPKKDMDKSYSFIDNLDKRLSMSSSGSEEDYLTPVSPHNVDDSILLDGEDSDVEADRRKSIIDRVAPKRSSNVYNVMAMNVTPPPSFPAPRPMSLAVWAEKIVENAESFPDRISAPHRSRRRASEVMAEDFPLPVATPRSYIRGLEPQDATAAFVHYLSWYLFFIARLLSIAALIQFHPVVAIIVLLCHYKLMLLLLIVPQASTVRRTFYIFLAFVYIFCLLEFKVRFRHVRVWHVFWLVLSSAEVFVFTALWGSNTNMNWWWQSFMVSVILGSILLSYMCMLVYFVLLKPKERVVYLSTKK